MSLIIPQTFYSVCFVHSYPPVSSQILPSLTKPPTSSPHFPQKKFSGVCLGPASECDPCIKCHSIEGNWFPLAEKLTGSWLVVGTRARFPSSMLGIWFTWVRPVLSQSLWGHSPSALLCPENVSVISSTTSASHRFSTHSSVVILSLEEIPFRAEHFKKMEIGCSVPLYV